MFFLLEFMKILCREQYKTSLKLLLKQFVPNALFLYPLKTSENLTIFWCFPGVEKRCIGNKWVNEMRNLWKNIKSPKLLILNKFLTPNINFDQDILKKTDFSKFSSNENSAVEKVHKRIKIQYTPVKWDHR